MIQDSGARKKFSTGAVRDICEGKGRCDLLPLDMVDVLLENETVATGTVLFNINKFRETKEFSFLLEACYAFISECDTTVAEAMLEVAKHFEEGANKYGEENWKKGIPLHCYVDSAVRHYLKYLAGWTDERHDRAVMWNLLCGAWTAVHIPDMLDK